MSDSVQRHYVSVSLPNGDYDLYVMAPHDLFDVPVLPGDVMVDENGKDIFTVFSASCCPSSVFYKHISGDDSEEPRFQEICYDQSGIMRFADECIHYSDRHSLVSWCLAHPEDCGDFDRNAYMKDHDGYLEIWQRS